MKPTGEAWLSPNQVFHGRASPSLCHISILHATTNCLQGTVFQQGSTFTESNWKTVARWRRCWGGWRRKGVGEGDGFVDGGERKADR